MTNEIKTGSRVSGLCMNGTVLRVNEYRMAYVKWDFGGREWVPTSILKSERKDWK